MQELQTRSYTSALKTLLQRRWTKRNRPIRLQCLHCNNWFDTAYKQHLTCGACFVLLLRGGAITQPSRLCCVCGVGPIYHMKPDTSSYKYSASVRPEHLRGAAYATRGLPYCSNPVCSSAIHELTEVITRKALRGDYGGLIRNRAMPHCGKPDVDFNPFVYEGRRAATKDFTEGLAKFRLDNGLLQPEWLDEFTSPYEDLVSANRRDENSCWDSEELYDLVVKDLLPEPPEFLHYWTHMDHSRCHENSCGGSQQVPFIPALLDNGRRRAAAAKFNLSQQTIRRIYHDGCLGRTFLQAFSEEIACYYARLTREIEKGRRARTFM